MSCISASRTSWDSGLNISRYVLVHLLVSVVRAAMERHFSVESYAILSSLCSTRNWCIITEEINCGIFNSRNVLYDHWLSIDGSSGTFCMASDRVSARARLLFFPYRSILGRLFVTRFSALVKGPGTSFGSLVTV